MNQTNSFVVDGNLVRDALLLEPKEGFKVCKFTIAVNRWYKNENGTAVDRVSFFDVETYGNAAEFCSKYGTKGMPVRIVGRLQQDRWTNKDGKQESKVYLVAEHTEFLRRPEKIAERFVSEKQDEQEAETATENTVAEVDMEEAAVF